MQSSNAALAQTYVAIQSAAWDARVSDPVALDAALRRIGAEGRAAWPGLEIADAVLTTWLADRAPDQTEPLEALAAMHTTDLYLACGCATGDRVALQLFEERIMPAVGPAVARIDADREFGQQVAEEVRVRLLVDGEAGPARIRSYIGRGPLTSWVQVAAMRLAYSQKRVRPSDRPEDVQKLAAVPCSGDDAEMSRIREEFAGPFREAFSKAMETLSPRDRNVLRLHLLEGLNTESIGRMYRVHRATVARWIARSHKALLVETRKRLSRTLALGPGEFESFMRLLQSQLEVSIVSALSD